MLVAITRGVSSSLARCELTHVERVPIDVERARQQHAAYEAALRDLGARVERAAAADEFPDAVFVEDTAVVLPEVAVMARPGAASRRGELEGVAEKLREYRRLVAIESPGTLDGGDVLRVGRTLYVGKSGRSNEEGARQLERLVGPYGFEVKGVRVKRCLHLKSAVTAIGETRVLVNPAMVEMSAFIGMDRVEVDPGEPLGANALMVGETLVYAEAYPRTLARLERKGLRVVTVDCSELAKAEGAVTCCSLVFEVRGI